MAKAKTKRGSKTKATCPICGKVLTTAGMIGHMHWKHGKDYKAPLLDKPKPIGILEARRKAKDFDKVLTRIVEDMMKSYRASPRYIEKEAKYLVHLRDIGLSHETLVPFVQDAVDRIRKARNLSFDEAKDILEEAIHKS